MNQYSVHSISRELRAIRIRREGKEGYDTAHISQGLQTLPLGCYIEKLDLQRYDFILSYKKIGNVNSFEPIPAHVSEQAPPTFVVDKDFSQKNASILSPKKDKKIIHK